MLLKTFYLIDRYKAPNLARMFEIHICEKIFPVRGVDFPIAPELVGLPGFWFSGFFFLSMLQVIPYPWSDADNQARFQLKKRVSSVYRL
jgi:hypothetical protein